MKKNIALTLALLLLASSCSAPAGPGETAPAETEAPAGIGEILDSVDLPSSFPSAGDGADIDLGSLTSAQIKAWAEAEPLDFASLDASGYVRLGQVEGLSVIKGSAVLTDEEFENELDALLENYAYDVEITDRAVAEGETVRADYAGYKDGEAFGGGTAYNQQITAQGGTGYIEGFAEAFIGQMPGEEFSFNVTFPENYGVEELNGQEVTFVATVHAILTGEEIVPELDDEFVSSNFSYDSAAEFRDAYRITVEKRKAYYVQNAVYNDLWESVLNGAEILAWPDGEVKRIYAEHRQAYENYASYYQTDYETFMKSYMNQTDEELYDMARSYVKEDLVMYALADRLGVHPTADEKDAVVNELAEYNGVSKEEMLTYYGEDTIEKSVVWQLAMEAVAASAVITEQ